MYCLETTRQSRQWTQGLSPGRYYDQALPFQLKGINYVYSVKILHHPIDACFESKSSTGFSYSRFMLKVKLPPFVLQVDLSNGTLVDSTLLPGAGRLPVYSLNTNTYVDMAVDELGLWVIHADPEYGGNLVITKLDKGRVLMYFGCIGHPQIRASTHSASTTGFFAQ